MVRRQQPPRPHPGRQGELLIDVALVTYSELPELFADDQPLARALAAAGLEVGIVRWDDPEFDWTGARIVLLRSTWDYFRRPAEFLAWASRVACRTGAVRGSLRTASVKYQSRSPLMASSRSAGR